MDIISAEEWELLGFFEVEPSKRDEDVAWPYNDFLYEITQNNLQLSCAIAPAYKDVRIILSNNDEKIYELNAVGVKDIKLLKEKGKEILKIDVNDLEVIFLRIKPCIRIDQKIEEKI